MSWRAQWTPQDASAGGFLLNGAMASKYRNTRQVYYTGDLWRAVMVPLIEAEKTVMIAFARAYDLGVGPDALFMSQVGGSQARDPGVVARYGDSVQLVYSAAQRHARQLIRSTVYTSDAPVWESGMGPPLVSEVSGSDLPLPKLGVAPILVGALTLLGVAALAAGAYVAGEYERSNASVEIERVRVHAELGLKQQVIQAQVAAGQVPQLDQATISAGKAEESRPYYIAAAGVGALLGVAALTYFQRKGGASWRV